MSLLPPEEDLELIHTREYETRVYYVSDTEMLARGAISDVKPPGLYVEDDPEPLEIHRMHVELRVRLPDLEITDARVVFENHPHQTCPMITTHYQQLVGLQVARGFTHKVRELFGGPRGCTHTTALLQAMAPAVVQSTWSMVVRQSRDAGPVPGSVDGAEDRARRFAGNVNTCHVWEEEGHHVAELRSGGEPPPPMQVVERLVKLGRKPEDWRFG